MLSINSFNIASDIEKVSKKSINKDVLQLNEHSEENKYDLGDARTSETLTF